jgi:transposase
MVRVRPLTERERGELKKGARREVGRVSERMHAVLLSARGYDVPKIASILEYDEATVRRWLERYEAEGLEGLQDRPRSGRPRNAGVAAQDSVRRAMERGPEACGHPGVALWTVVLLQTHLLIGLGLQLSHSSVRRLVHAMGYAWRRPRHVLPKDPETDSKMRHICSTLLTAPADAVVFCLDECDIHLMPVLRAMWMRRGQQADVPTPGHNRKRGIFGALELEGGAFHYTITLSKKAVDFIAFLEMLTSAYPDRPMYLVLDNASIHHAKLVQKWLEEQPRVHLLFLPAYSGHRYNPIEKVWWHLKQRVAANRLHGSIDELVSAVHQYFATRTPAETLKLAA